MRASSYLCLGLMLAMSACQGSWADQTVVHLDPFGKAAVKGLAIVSIGKACDDQGNCHYEGSNLMLQLTEDNAASTYRIILAQGNCSKPPTHGVVLTKSDGNTLDTRGTGGYVDIPIISLTGGNYAISVQTVNHVIVACGVIHRSGPV